MEFLAKELPNLIYLGKIALVGFTGAMFLQMFFSETVPDFIHSKAFFWIGAILTVGAIF